MRSYVASLLVVGFIGACAHGDDRLDELFASWQEAHRGVKSLVVDFTLETWDPIFKDRERAEGTFRLVRTAKGEVFASYELVHKRQDDKPLRLSGLLNGGAVYLLDQEKKTAHRFEFTDDELRKFLEQYFNPFVLLLDRKRAEDNCRLAIVKQDESYSYLVMKSKQAKRSVWFFGDTFDEGRATLMNKASEDVPKDMPRQLWYRGVSKSEYTFEIKAWRLNAANAPKLEVFAKPEDRPGWKVTEWPFQAKK
jgi:hypothetical protein